MTGPVVVELAGVTKEFRGNAVLHRVDFDLRAGEVHALVGANGSGKSTLMKIVYGVHRPSDGTMAVRGAAVRLRNPGHALRLGIAAVPQELPLVGAISVAENVFFGNLPRRRGVVNWRELRRRAAQVLVQVDTAQRIDPAQPVQTLDLAAQQLVSIARALGQGANILVFDEPTSSLDADAARHLFEVIHRLRTEGRAIAFISQRLDDIFAVAGRVSVLRDGAIVAELPIAEATTDGIAELMVGHAPVAVPRRPNGSSSGAGCVLEVDRVAVGRRVRSLSLSVSSGEVLGLAGLPGSGPDELLPALFGRNKLASGSVKILGTDMTKWPPRRRVSSGVAYVSGDRRGEGLVRSQTVAFNLTLVLNHRARLSWLSHRRQRRRIDEVTTELRITPPSPDAVVATLSGGNQQKVVVGRWLLAGARFWILNDPTRGVDIHARSDIHRLIRQQVAAGGGALMTSSDIRELLEVCDRVVVMSRGAVVAELDPAHATEHQVLALAGGAVLPAQATVGLGDETTDHLVDPGGAAVTGFGAALLAPPELRGEHGAD